ncbi:MAG: hypothetical protein MUP81_03260 [Dehalococcoidia bacterium]|nr:hypothetical protein [Dehalococcoidia bacterium]
MPKKTKTWLTKKNIGKAARELRWIFGRKAQPVKELKAILLYLLDNYVSVCLEKGILTVETEDLVGNRSGNNLGAAQITIDLKRACKDFLCFDSFLKVHSVQRPHSHFPNDHVGYEGKSLCPGEGRYALKKALREGRIDDFVDITKQILCTA